MRLDLPRGRDSAITLSALAEVNGCSRREVEASIQAARLDGTPIISSSEGVWLGTDDEALEWCKRASRRAMTQLETIKAVERGVERRRTRQEGFPWAA